MSDQPATNDAERRAITDPIGSLRTIMMGTGPFAVPSFEALRAAGHDVALVVTKPQPAVKSRKATPASPVRSWAQAHGLPIDDPQSINDPGAVEKLKAIDADLMVVCDYGQILKPEALAAARLGGINLHGSLLPAYRGAAPVQWSLLCGDRVTGVSVIHMTPRLDGGPILVTRETAIDDRETAGELEDRLSLIGVEATMQAVRLLGNWDGISAIGTPQQQSKVSKAPRLKKSDGEIVWSRTAREIDCHVRGMQPWPIAFTFLALHENKPPVRLAIKETRLAGPAGAAHEPGTLVEGHGLLVATSDQIVEITRLQPAGKREMTGIEFLRGHKLQPGTRLGRN